MSSIQRAPYYCYRCKKFLNHEHVQESPSSVTCRFCSSGFIEEVQPGINNLTDDDDSGSGENGVDITQLFEMIAAQVGGNGAVPPQGAEATAAPQNANQQNAPMDFLRTHLLPFIQQQMGGNNREPPRRSSSTGPSTSNRRREERQGAGNDGGDVGPNFIQQLLGSIMAPNTNVRIQFGNGANINLGDFAPDGNIDAVITQLINQFDPNAANAQRISEEALQRLPRSKVTQRHVNNDAQCTTCMDLFNLGEEVGELACHHIFHPDCIIPWLRSHNTCPICRATVDSETWGNNPANPIPPQPIHGFRDGDELD